MIETYFVMKCNPFRKGFDQKNKYEFKDYKEMQARLAYLQKTHGIGLFTGSPGKENIITPEIAMLAENELSLI